MIRVKNCLRIDMLSVHIPRSMTELCALETRSCKTAVLRNAHSKIAKLGKVMVAGLDKALCWKELDSEHQILQRGSRKTVDNYKPIKKNVYDDSMWCTLSYHYRSTHVPYSGKFSWSAKFRVFLRAEQ